MWKLYSYENQLWKMRLGTDTIIFVFCSKDGVCALSLSWTRTIWRRVACARQRRSSPHVRREWAGAAAPCTPVCCAPLQPHQHIACEMGTNTTKPPRPEIRAEALRHADSACMAGRRPLATEEQQKRGGSQCFTGSPREARV